MVSKRISILSPHDGDNQPHIPMFCNSFYRNASRHLGYADEFSLCQFWKPLKVCRADLLRTEHQGSQRVDDVSLRQGLLALLSLHLLVVGW